MVVGVMGLARRQGLPAVWLGFFGVDAVRGDFCVWG